MIVLVRHGETAVNVAGRLQGRIDVPLTEAGRAHAERLGAVLAEERPAVVVTSPLRRARETATAIADAAGVPLEVDDRIVELDYGDWDGRPVAEVGAADWARWRADPSFTPPGGESLVDVFDRVATFCEEHLQVDRRVVAVSHVSPIKAAAAWALGTGPSTTWHMFLALGSVTRVVTHAGGACLLSLNEAVGG